jgi:hypothetical protein
MLDGLAVSEEDAQEADEKWEGEGIMRLGNASEPFDSTNAWIASVKLTPRQERDFAEARGEGRTTLDK